MNDPKPCDTCTRVKNCTGTKCPAWIAWFPAAWDAARLRLLQLLTEKEEKANEEGRN